MNKSTHAKLVAVGPQAVQGRRGNRQSPTGNRPEARGAAKEPHTSDPWDERGSALVEYAIVLAVLLTFLLGIMDFSRFLYTYHFVSEVAREGTRYAVVRGSTHATTACASTSTFACNATAANVTSYVQSLTPPGINSGWLTGCPSVTPCVNTTWPGTAPTGAATACNAANGNNSPGCLVQVAVSYPFKFMLPFLPKSSSTWTVSSTSVMVISQ